MVFFVLIGILASACTRSFPASDPQLWQSSARPTVPSQEESADEVYWLLITARPIGAAVLTPTPDAPHPLPTLRTNPITYTVQQGDTLARIAQLYGVSLEAIAQANGLSNPNLLEIGQSLTIPPPQPYGMSTDFKIIPDSELVYSPATIAFDIEAFVHSKGGYLAKYWEEVEGRSLSGAQIVQSIAQDYSVNPRLLLALLEYQSGWLTQAEPGKAAKRYPFGLRDTSRLGLYRQMSWAANGLNRGYYLWRVHGVATWLLQDGQLVLINNTINAGTAAVQHFFSLVSNQAAWERAVSAEGLFRTYYTLFGYPFDYAIEPLLPPGLQQPQMQLPFEPGVTWSFTSGPHGAWGDGSAWGALDFAPPGEAVGCVPSDAWVVAVADGLIVRAENGVVIQDLDNDGYEQTGWVVLYLHIATPHRVQAGTFLHAGERIGHPSCEGGISTGTHVHLARRYNGEWIPADQNLPFILDGWISIGSAREYDGFLQKDSQTLEAFAGKNETNQISR